MSLIRCVVNKGSYEEVRHLLEIKGANVNYTDSYQQNVLHYCVIYSKGGTNEQVRMGASIIRLFALYGANVNAVDLPNLSSPLTKCTINGCHPELLTALLDANADPNIEDRFGNVALYYYMLNYGYVDDMNTELFRRLIPNLGINRANCNGQTALSIAILKGCDKECIRALLLAGADVQISKKNNFNRSIIHDYVDGYSVRQDANSLEVLKLLVSSGADVNHLDEYGHTPLMLFFLGGIRSIRHMKVLLDNGADVHVTDSCGNGFLHHQLMSCSIDLCRLFLDCGVDPNRVNKYNETPLTNAAGYCMMKDTDFISILRNYGAKINMNCVMFEKNQTDQIVPVTVNFIVMHYYENEWKVFDKRYETILKHVFLTDVCFFVAVFSLDYSYKMREFGWSLINELYILHRYILPSGVTLAQFLLENDKNKYVYYFPNAGSVNKDFLQVQFPQFSEILWSKIEVARRWTDTRNRLENISMSSQPSMDGHVITLNTPCIRHLAQFLNNYELQNFIRASVSD